MQKIILKIDVSKLTKSKLKKNSYTKRDGSEANEINASLVLIEKKEPREVKTGDTWTLMETHFIAEEQTKEEKEKGAKVNYVGTGSQFIDKNASTGQIDAKKEDTAETTNSLDVPF